MEIIAIRLKPNQDLKKELLKITKENNIKAGFVLSCAGSLKKANIRLADEDIKTFNKNFEIVSLSGTLSQDGIHIHISIADKDGITIGGHLLNDSLINTTAEIIIGITDQYNFKRIHDNQTNFKELVIEK